MTPTPRAAGASIATWVPIGCMSSIWTAPARHGSATANHRKVAGTKGRQLQVGGGLRNTAAVAQMLDLRRRARGGRQRAVTPWNWCVPGCDYFGPERITLAFDVRLDPRHPASPPTDGSDNRAHCLWTRWTIHGFELKHVLCTDVSRDGALTGPNVALYAKPCGAFRTSNGRPPAAFAMRAGSAGAAASGRGGGHQRQGAARRAHDPGRGIAAILAKRIIPCLDVRDGQVVKGVRFRDHRIVGDILELAPAIATRARTNWCSTTSPRARRALGGSSWVRAWRAPSIFPFASPAAFARWRGRGVLASGAEKISVNSPALAIRT
jgi:imidazole glycerol phosphate synthase subunit HisF